MFAKRYLSYVLLCALAINSFEVGIELFYGPNRQETKVNHKKVKSMGGWQCLFFFKSLMVWLFVSFLQLFSVVSQIYFSLEVSNSPGFWSMLQRCAIKVCCVVSTKSAINTINSGSLTCGFQKIKKKYNKNYPQNN